MKFRKIQNRQIGDMTESRMMEGKLYLCTSLNGSLNNDWVGGFCFTENGTTYGVYPKNQLVYSAPKGMFYGSELSKFREYTHKITLTANDANNGTLFKRDFN